MTERFIWRAGDAKRKLHLAEFDRLGRPIGALCHARSRFDQVSEFCWKDLCATCRAIERRYLAKGT